MVLLECFRSYCLEHSEKYRVLLKLQIHPILKRPKDANEASTLPVCLDSVQFNISADKYHCTHFYKVFDQITMQRSEFTILVYNSKFTANVAVLPHNIMFQQQCLNKITFFFLFYQWCIFSELCIFLHLYIIAAGFNREILRTMIITSETKKVKPLIIYSNKMLLL